MTTTRKPATAAAPVSLVIDHITPHFGLGTVSIHCVRVDGTGARTTGFDIDNVTKEELGIPVETPLLEGLTEKQLLAFVSKVEGLPVVVDVPTVREAPTDEEAVVVAVKV